MSVVAQPLPQINVNRWFVCCDFSFENPKEFIIMVDLSGGPDGPIEHGFSNSVFVIPGLIIFLLSGK